MNQFSQLDTHEQAYRQSVGAKGAPTATTQEEPTPLIHETGLGDPFPIDALGPLQDAAIAIQDKTQAPEVMSGLSTSLLRPCMPHSSAC